MKPYQLKTPDGEWVDLSAIQSITPPFISEENFHSGILTITMTWRCAFQDKPRYAEWRLDHNLPDELIGQKELDKIKKNVFEPFFEAWSKQLVQS